MTTLRPGLIEKTPKKELLMELKFDSNGLIPAIAQDATSGEVLMVAWMNAEAVRLTVETGEAHFWSRSRQEMWRKGATSGNVLTVREVWVDCDGDTLLLKVDAAGPTCHSGERSCFFRRLEVV
ncbi:MAG: phosphoribosyl-AMP cyclohydrolase [Anaerolineales bacterium]|nr:phosphoribosyl-AMP cyclohydrolase [Anaerolineales bacterium]